MKRYKGYMILNVISVEFGQVKCEMPPCSSLQKTSIDLFNSFLSSVRNLSASQPAPQAFTQLSEMLPTSSNKDLLSMLMYQASL